MTYKKNKKEFEVRETKKKLVKEDPDMKLKHGGSFNQNSISK